LQARWGVFQNRLSPSHQPLLPPITFKSGFCYKPDVPIKQQIGFLVVLLLSAPLSATECSTDLLLKSIKNQPTFTGEMLGQLLHRGRRRVHQLVERALEETHSHPRVIELLSEYDAQDLTCRYSYEINPQLISWGVVNFHTLFWSAARVRRDLHTTTAAQDIWQKREELARAVEDYGNQTSRHNQLFRDLRLVFLEISPSLHLDGGRKEAAEDEARIVAGKLKTHGIVTPQEFKLLWNSLEDVKRSELEERIRARQTRMVGLFESDYRVSQIFIIDILSRWASDPKSPVADQAVEELLFLAAEAGEVPAVLRPISRYVALGSAGKTVQVFDRAQKFLQQHQRPIEDIQPSP
jgi:hypothetical protein